MSEDAGRRHAENTMTGRPSQSHPESERDDGNRREWQVWYTKEVVYNTNTDKRGRQRQESYICTLSGHSHNTPEKDMMLYFSTCRNSSSYSVSPLCLEQAQAVALAEAPVGVLSDE